MAVTDPKRLALNDASELRDISIPIPAPPEVPTVPEFNAPAPEKSVLEPREDKPAVSSKPEKPLVVSVQSPPAVPAPVSPRTKKIEHILSEDVLTLYGAMTPEQQAAFRTKAKTTLTAIAQMIDSGRVIAKKVFELIRAWLILIPGINQYFLEQEAKIKTDKIIALSKTKQ